MLILYIAIPIAIYIALRLIRATFFSEASRRPSISQERCRCGYAMEHLDMARCPECGRVRHFNATPEELGLSPEELARAEQKRNEREKNLPL
jgi:hypothetical protein